MVQTSVESVSDLVHVSWMYLGDNNNNNKMYYIKLIKSSSKDFYTVTKKKSISNKSSLIKFKICFFF